MNIEKILEKLIKFNTVEDKDNNEIIKWTTNLLRLLGFKLELVENKKSNKASLFATIGNNPSLTFLGHTDTVSAGENWTMDPLAMKIDGDRIYGLGSSDMKGGIAAFLSAISQINFKNCKRGLNILFTYDEEINFSGIKDFIKKKKLNMEYIIVGEPTGMIPIVASKGIVSFKIDFFGKECHGSEPNKGINAIILACNFIDDVEKYFKTIEDCKNDIFSPNYATINTGKINGGDAVNKVPARCTLEIECRTIAKNQNNEIYENFLKIANKYNAKIKIVFSAPPTQCADKKFIYKIEKITKKKGRGANYATDGSFLNNLSSKMIILGPGPFNSHKPDEWVSKKSLYKTAQTYKIIALDFVKKV